MGQIQQYPWGMHALHAVWQSQLSMPTARAHGTTWMFGFVKLKSMDITP
jgi:hypothetical protein